MKTFVIQSKNIDGYTIPAQSYGYTAIKAIDYANWFNREQTYKYVLNNNLSFKSFEVGAPEAVYYNYLKRDFIPIGSVEYVLAWLKLMGIDDVKPLNIPEELWKFCDRKITIDYLNNLDGWWFVKDIEKTKDIQNDKMYLRLGDTQNNGKKYFCTEWIDNVVSEWRVFVLDKNIKGIRCYSGNEWIIPNKHYIQSIVDIYDKQCYTLDVMIYGDHRHTEIVELHDFFACSLYGFEDYTTLLKMWIETINELCCVTKALSNYNYNFRNRG